MEANLIDKELQNLIDKRISLLGLKTVIIGTGITSSHLGDERNLREFFIADSVVKYLEKNKIAVTFILADDSYDPLNFRQLRVAVKKDPALIEKFEKYCGMPIKLIPDPYDCHNNYSEHYQSQIKERLAAYDIYPDVVDIFSVYESGTYDFAKEIVFTNKDKIDTFLKRCFPNYTMKKIFWAVCDECQKMDDTDINEIDGDNVIIACGRCKSERKKEWKKLKGKFSWKIDTAIKWNIFKTDFEPFSKAYLDPDVGSYIIAKSLSDEFFGGKAPDIIEYGQVIMDKSLSYKLIPSLPKDIFKQLFLNKRKRDLTLNENKIVEFARHAMLKDRLSYFDYVKEKLPYEALEKWQLNKKDDLIGYGEKFTEYFLHKNLYPKLPDASLINSLDIKTLQQIKKILIWVLTQKKQNSQKNYKTFSKRLSELLVTQKINMIEIYPQIRKLFSQEEGVSLSRIFFFLPEEFIDSSLNIISIYSK